MNLKKVSIKDKLGKFSDLWNPRIVGELNNHHVKLAKLKGEFVWHMHKDEDEMFYVVEGDLSIEFRTHRVELGPGDFIIVPKGIEHKPVANNEVSIMLIEPKSTRNTGDVMDVKTKDKLEWI